MRLADRLFKKILFEPMSGCWLWTGSSMPEGYGRVFLDGKVGCRDIAVAVTLITQGVL